MKIEVERRRILIYPEGAADEAYIEEVLGLLEEGNAVLALRENMIGSHRLCRLQVTRDVKKA